MKATGDGTTNRTAAGSRADVLQQVSALLRSELRLPGTDNLDEDVQLDLLPGADSVRLMRVIADLERTYAVEFDDDAIRSADSIGDLVTLVVSTVLDADGQP
jgi:acyl carrier protein